MQLVDKNTNLTQVKPGKLSETSDSFYRKNILEPILIKSTGTSSSTLLI